MIIDDKYVPKRQGKYTYMASFVSLLFTIMPSSVARKEQLRLAAATYYSSKLKIYLSHSIYSCYSISVGTRKQSKGETRRTKLRNALVISQCNFASPPFIKL